MEAAVLLLDLNRNKLNRVGAQSTAMCPLRID